MVCVTFMMECGVSMKVVRLNLNVLDTKLQQLARDDQGHKLL